MSYIKIWVHLIWATKNRCAVITKDLKYKLYDHIRENAKRKGIYLDHINGTKDHLHLLISLGGEQSIAKVVRLIKGESSRWINANKLTKTKFAWQSEYISISVSESILSQVRDYIRNQEDHHHKRTFEAEYEIFINKYGFNKFGAKAN